LTGLRYAIALLVSLLAHGYAAGGERYDLQGSSVSIELPAVFAPVYTDWPGFIGGSGLSTVLGMQMNDFELPFDGDEAEAEIEAFISNINLGSGGQSAGQLIFTGGHLVLLVEDISESNGVRTSRWTAYIKSDPVNAVVFSQIDLPAQQPRFASIWTREQVIKSLRTVDIGAALSFSEQLAVTGLSLDMAAPFLHGVASGRMATTLSIDRLENIVGDEPSIVIFRMDSVSVTDLSAAGDEFLGPDRNIELEQPVTFAGGDGVRRIGSWNPAGAKGSSFVQYVGAINGRSIVLNATAPVSEMTPHLVSAIDQIAASVRSVDWHVDR
jgi:hypothetical protein